MPVLVLAFLLAALACPVHAQEGEVEIPVQDAIVEEEPQPAPEPDPAPELDPAPEPVPEPEPEPSFSLEPPPDYDSGFQVDGEEVWIGLEPGITSSEGGVDGAAILELLSSIDLMLGYILVMALFSCLVTAGKLIYSFFNMFF